MSRRQDLYALAVLAAFNLFVVWPLLSIEYLAHTGSIEVAFIAIAERIRAAFPHFGWWPEWYGGIPFQNSYPPVLHMTVAAAGWLLNTSTAHAYHLVTALFYCGGPLALYWLARALSASVPRAFLAGLFVSVLSPSAWLIPAVRGDLRSLWGARRFQTTVYWGEGPHTTSIALLLVAIVLLHFAMKDRRWSLAAALGLAATVLTNWLGGFALAAAVLAYLFAYGNSLSRWFRAGLLGVMAYALAAPWIPPSTLLAIRTNAQIIGGDFRFGPANAAALVAILAVAAVLTRVTRKPELRFALAFAWLMCAITLGAERFGFSVLPQPQRYHVEMEFALALLAALLIPMGRWTLPAVGLAAIYPAFFAAGYAHALTKPIDVTRTSEYRVARWFDANMQGRRVFAPGAMSFAMNIWTATPQIGGGFDQGITNNLLPGAQFQIYSGMGAGTREGKIAIDLLRLLGAHAVAVSGPGSTEPYKPIANPAKFEGKLDVLWRDGGDVIYRVPQRSASLARAIPRSAVIEKAPAYFTMTEVFHPYLAACDDPAMPDVSFKWLDRNRAEANGELKPEQVISFQIAYHGGWRAQVNGSPRPLRADSAGLMLLEPECNGPCRVDLVYDGGREMLAARLLCAMGFLAGAMLLRRANPPTSADGSGVRASE
jgi:hypothetical protein